MGKGHLSHALKGVAIYWVVATYWVVAIYRVVAI